MKRYLSLALALLMVVAIFAACKPESEPEPTKTTAPETKTEEKATEAPTEEVTEPEMPEYSEITVEIFDRGTDGGKTDPTNNYWTQWITDKVLADENIGVTFQAVSRWEETEQLNNLMAAGSAPDVCVTYSTDLISNYRDLGGLTNIEPYIDTLLVDLKDFLGPDLAVPGRDMIMRDMIPETGEVYSVPARRINVARINTFIRKDWVDALGMELPTTTQEYYDTLMAFKEQDPGGVGADKVLAFSMTDDVRWRAGNLLDSFIDPTLSERDLWVNTVIDRSFLVPGYKEGVRFLNKMYNAGLIDPEFPLYNEDPPCDNLIKSGVVGSFIHNWDQPYRDSPGLLTDLLANVPTAEIVAIDPFQNSAGVTKKYIYDSAGIRFVVPVFSENVEGALRYANWMARYENRSYLQIGDEGVNHELVNGVPKLMAAEGEKIMNSGQNLDYTFPINGVDLGSDELNAKAIANGYSVEPALVTMAYDAAMKNGVPLPVIPVPLSAAGPVSQTLTDKGKTLMAESITCSPEEFDAVWDAGIADWLASGAQEVIDERAMKYDEFTGN